MHVSTMFIYMYANMIIEGKINVTNAKFFMF